MFQWKTFQIVLWARVFLIFCSDFQLFFFRCYVDIFVWDSRVDVCICDEREEKFRFRFFFGWKSFALFWVEVDVRERERKKRNRDVKVIIQMVNTDEADHCTKDALTSFLGYMLQAVLAGLAFTCLIGTSHNRLHFRCRCCCCCCYCCCSFCCFINVDFSYLSLNAHVHSLRKWTDLL